MESSERRFAVLIDADNISEKYIKVILDELSTDGTATYKRIYGDWTSPNLGRWKQVLLDNSVTPVQQYAYTSGKNATDSAMIIDAMDILYTGHVEGFCIVSSDSDFTRLAARLREAGMYVVGMGETKTPKPFIAACNKFTYLDVICRGDEPCEGKSETERQEKQRRQEQEALRAIIADIAAVVDEVSDEDGWAHLGYVGTTLQKRYPDFDVRNYGFKKLTPFVQSLGAFEVKGEKNRGGSAVVYLRNREKENHHGHAKSSI